MTRQLKLANSITLAVAIVAVGLWFASDTIHQYFFKPTPTKLEEGVEDPAETVVAQDLKIPWEIAFLPNGESAESTGSEEPSLLVTERPGTLRRIGANGQVFNIKGVVHKGEGGLLGLALHPEFEQNQQLYLYLTTQSGDGLVNRVERYQLQGDQLTNRTVIIDGIPGAAFHDGGRIAFGPDGLLYITAGDAGEPELAQDTSSLAGKILRLNSDGSVPDDNPFGNAVYSYGHRNPQGLAWDDQGRLWATEHGPSGLASGHDELNLIERGANYGWPVIRGDETAAGMRQPIAHSGAEETWAPAGVAFLEGSLFFAGLRGEALYEASPLTSSQFKLKTHFHTKLGRLRAVAVGPDGWLYMTTSNTDGRGTVRPGDDKIIKFNVLFGR